MRIYQAKSLPDPTSRLTTPYFDNGTAWVYDDSYYIKIMDLRATEKFTIREWDNHTDIYTFKSLLHLTTTGWLRWGDLRRPPPGLVAPGLIKMK
ncbi:hypothetical protein [Pseudomonas urmiensis]|uniref:Uncharacterized protein n=1 Tax=Pseudomonas urmiensis TaxID=2745493 RepID=A0A923G372_9PSED|nr:hypothetical protein [Pseudomonas urmiensis]MBV4537285.1 hypothetical protein [Pseudomonas urmiensis]